MPVRQNARGPEFVYRWPWFGVAYGALGDFYRGRILMRITLVLLRLFNFSNFNKSSGYFKVYLGWHSICLISHADFVRLPHLTARLIYHDAPSADTVMGTESVELKRIIPLLSIYLLTTISLTHLHENGLPSINDYVSTYWLIFLAIFCTLERLFIGRNWLAILGHDFLMLVHFMRMIAQGIILYTSECALAGQRTVAKAYRHFVPHLERRRESAAYTYEVLGGPRDIRLLKLSRRLPFNDVSFKMVQIELENAPSFEAMSYTWGNSDKTKGVIIDGHWLWMTENAYRILKSRSPRYGSRLLWIDAICIDQSNIKEKEKQVALMGSIYRRASRVVIWLGTAPDVRPAIDLMWQLRCNLRYFKPITEDRTQLHALEGFDERWPAFLRLLEHPYWRRAWIVQEIAFAKTAHIVYGGFWVHWADFAEVAKGFLEPEKNAYLLYFADFRRMGRLLPSDECFAIGSIDHIRTLLREGHSFSLLELLIKTRKAHATDLRDKVYATQGLSNLKVQDQRVDYSWTIERTYTEVARLLLRMESNPLHVLHFAGVGVERNLSLPSWVPDWSTLLRDRQGYLSMPVSELEVQDYNSCGQHTVSKVQTIAKPTDRRLTVSVTALIVDVTAEITAPFPDLRTHSTLAIYTQYANSILDWFLQTEAFVARHLSNVYEFTRDTRRNVYLRTLLCNRTRDSTLTLTDCQNLYDNTMRLCKLQMTLQKRVAHAQDKMEDEPSLENLEEWTEQMTQFLRILGAHLFGRCIAVTKGGYLMVVPPRTRVNDQIAIIEGATTPFLIRPSTTDGKAFQLVGECYVHGIMNGEVADRGPFVRIELI